MRFLIIGAGSIGKRHMRCLRELGHEVAACDTDETRLAGLAGSLGAKCYTDLDAALGGGYDAALVCTPTSLHIEIARKAVERGLHIFVEKPVSDTPDGIDDLASLAEKAGLKSLVGCNTRFYRPLTRVKDYIDSGKMGRTLSARAQVGFYLPYWHPNDDYTKAYSANRSMGGGVILDDIHELDYLRWFFGEAKEVYCVAVNTGTLSIDTEDLAAMVITFDGGVIAEVHFDYLQRTYHRRAEFVGENGLVVCDFIRQSTEFFGEEVYLSNTKSEGLNADVNHMYIGQMAHFVRVIRGEEESINDLVSAKKTLELALAAKESAEKHMPVRLG
ncbi:MAG: Gfo/Idh/MocA family oxidoreductase [Nitrospirae bacterium]|nr:Gfo/Idh/MocA family oxidoreductase [Nitrospirota bacterium]